MATYDAINSRADLTDVLLPDQVISDIIQELPKQSVLMNRAKQVRLTSKKAKQPVLSTLPEAYWIDGDTGLIETTKSDWENIVITTEDLGVIVPIPNTILDDANIPLWDEVKPLLAEAIGKKIDSAGLFGVDKPSSWPDAVVTAATTAGNVVTRGTGEDLGVDVAALGSKLAGQGYGVNGFAAKPGLQWELVGLRNKQGDPIYTQSLAGTPTSGLYGYPLNEVVNGAWDSEKADILAADWSKFVIGIRQDITYDLFREGSITDASGKVVLNLMQQRCSALLVTARVGFQVAAPKTRLGGKYPAGVIAPSSAGALSMNAEVHVPNSVTAANTIAEIDAYAEAHGIDISAASNKAEKLELIEEAE